MDSAGVGSLNEYQIFRVLHVSHVLPSSLSFLHSVETITIEPQLSTPYQYIRLNCLKRANKPSGYSLWEVEVVQVYGPTTSNPPTLSTLPSMSAQPSPSIHDYQNPLLPPAARATDLLVRMNIEEKIGQMTQVERKSLDNDQHIADYYIGSLLSGGGSYPDTNAAESWADMVDAYQDIVMTTRLAIPIIYGVDAVRGNSNVWNTTIFPHNIGLGASHNATRAEEVGKITAKEVYATGIRWIFLLVLPWHVTSVGEEPMKALGSIQILPH